MECSWDVIKSKGGENQKRMLEGHCGKQNKAVSSGVSSFIQLAICEMNSGGESGSDNCTCHCSRVVVVGSIWNERFYHLHSGKDTTSQEGKLYRVTIRTYCQSPRDGSETGGQAEGRGAPGGPHPVCNQGAAGETWRSHTTMAQPPAGSERSQHFFLQTCHSESGDSAPCQGLFISDYRGLAPSVSLAQRCSSSPKIRNAKR